MGFGTWFWTVTDFIPIVGTVARGLQAAGCAAVGDIHCSVEAGKNMAINLTADVVTPLIGPAARVGGFAAKTAGKGALRVGEKLVTRTIAKTGTEIAAKAGGEAITKAAAETAAKKAGKAAAKAAAKEEAAKLAAEKNLKKEVLKETLKNLSMKNATEATAVSKAAKAASNAAEKRVLEEEANQLAKKSMELAAKTGGAVDKEMSELAGKKALERAEERMAAEFAEDAAKVSAESAKLERAAAETAVKEAEEEAGKKIAKEVAYENSTLANKVWDAAKPRPIDLLGGVAAKGAKDAYLAIRGVLQGDKQIPDDDDVPSFVDDDDDWIDSMYWGDNPLNKKTEDDGSREPEDDGSRRPVVGTEDKKETQINPGVDLSSIWNSKNNYFIDDINLYNAARSLEHEIELADQVSNPAGQSSYDDTSILLLLTSLGFAYYIVSE